MKALSLTQPWASLVAIGAKKIETRSWKTPYRGTLAIHASKRFEMYERALCAQEPFKTALLNHNAIAVRGYAPNEMLDTTELPLGGIVAVCDVTAVCFIDTERREDGAPSIMLGGNYRVIVGNELAFGDYGHGRFAWVLENLRALKEPILCKGALSLWDVPANVESLVREQLNNV